MIRMFGSRRSCQRLRWATAAIMTALLFTGWTFIVSPFAAAGGLPPAPPNVVAAGLGVELVRAEIVILVDTSYSMSTGQNGLYPAVRTELPKILDSLSRQAPQDTVAIIEFSKTTKLVYTGPPDVKAAAKIPADATGVEANIGAAFQQAFSTLAAAPAGVKVGGVLLLSDGEIYAPGDPAFGSYGAPGWALLRTRINSLPIRVTGFGLRLSADKVLVNNLSVALGKAFGTNVIIAGNGTDLASGLPALGQGLLDSAIAIVAAQENGKGVRVTWSGLPGTDGRRPLNLTSAGHMDVAVTLTAMTRHVPLYLTGLSVKSPGLSDAVSGTLPALDEMLAPGQSVTLPVHLTWRPKPSGISFTGAPRATQSSPLPTTKI